MLKYANIINEEQGLVEIGLGDDDNFYKSIGMKLQDVQQSDIDNNWYLTEKCPMKTEEQKEQEERERINKLTCTKRVLVLALESLGFDYFETIQPMIEADRQAKLEWELCKDVERSNPLLEIIGQQLGITSEQIDNIFIEVNNGV